MYSRDGRFRITLDNTLVSLSGNYPVMGDAGIIKIPFGSDVTTTRHGNLYAGTDFVGKLKITVFENFSDMNAHLSNLSATFFTLDKPIDVLEGDSHYNLLQGYISQANVFRSYDSWYYKTAHRSTINSLDMLISTRRTLFNALP